MDLYAEQHVLYCCIALTNHIAAVQYGEGGGKWGRRRPRWLMVERAYLHNLWRASQAAHKWWATPDTPSAPLTSIPPMHKVGVIGLTKHYQVLPTINETTVSKSAGL